MSHADSSAPPPPPPKKRKDSETRSPVWDHFDKILDEDGNLIKAKCKYCGKIYVVDPKRHDTSSLKGHSLSCFKNPQYQETRQTQLAFSANSENEFVLTKWVFKQERVRKATAKMIIMDELPFKFVDGRGWRQWVQEACPMFKILSRWMVNRDIFSIFFEERSTLKKFFKDNSQRVSLTTDTWTFVQMINYMCITAHYIDVHWRLNKKIISFVPIQSHKADAIAKALEGCLVEWSMKNISTITVDNASSNDIALGLLKSKLVSWGCSSVRAQYLHRRCVAHILNLVVQDGLKLADSSVRKLRDTVRWVRGSPARLFKFRDLATLLGVEEKSSLCLDVPTRWNSTFMMIRNAIPYRVVLEAYEGHDATFKLDLDDSVLSGYDWVYLESFATLLKTFYEMTIRISGSLYVYLDEAIVDDRGDFDLLMWWKLNNARFPILSKVARDALAVPVSTVASESTFSTSGRVLDNFRSSLTPKIVEALICTQDWLRGPNESVAVEENLEDLEKFEKEMENLKIGTSSARGSGTEDSPSTHGSNEFFEVDS